MGLLDLFRRPTRTDPVFGALVYSRRSWRGQIAVPELHADALEFELEAQKNSEREEFHSIIQGLRTNAATLNEQIAEAAFATWTMYVDEERKEGLVSDRELAKYPSASGLSDIWNVLEPFRLTLTSRRPEDNAALWIEVNGANPHYFIAFLKDAKLQLFEVEG